MEARTDRFYPSAPFQNSDLEQRLEKKLNEVNSLGNHINNIREMIAYFKDKNKQVKKEIRNIKQ